MSAAESRATSVVFCADDYGLTEGVSEGIADLTGANRLSATSALVNTPHFMSHVRRLKELRNKIAVGLHINLTHGRPLGEMPRLAPAGILPSVGTLVAAALSGRIEPAEIAREVSRQIDCFAAQVGELPDFFDGHHHVHALPCVRRGVFAAIRRAFPDGQVTVRNPGDNLGAILARNSAVIKALAIACLSGGFARAVREASLKTNVGFAGFSYFRAQASYARELQRFFLQPGPRHLVMCHPGHVDAELQTIDPHCERRRQELEVIKAADWLAGKIARPLRLSRSRIELWTPSSTM